MARKFKMRLFQIVFKHCDLKVYLPRKDIPTTISFHLGQKQGIFRRFSSKAIQSVFHPEFGSFDFDNINDSSGTEIQSWDGQFSFALRNMLALTKIGEKCKDTKDDFDVHIVQCKKKDWSQTLKFFCCFYKIPFSSCKTRVRLVKNSCSIWHWR